MSQRSLAFNKGWKNTPIDQLLAPMDDGRILHHGWSPQCDVISSPSEEEWGVLKTTSIQPGNYWPHENKRLPENLKPRPQLEVREGDLLLTCAGPRARCGVACLVKHTRPRLIFSGKMYRMRPDPDKIQPRYLEAFLQSSEAQDAIDKMKTGISDSGLNLTHDRFKRLLVPLAPRDEQDSIADEIEKQHSRIDAGSVALKRVQANLKRYRAAVLKAACEGRLVPTEAEFARQEGRTYESGAQLLERILVERREKWNGRGKYREPVGPDTSGLGELPEGWVWGTAEQLSDETRAITYGVIKLGAEVLDGVPVLRTSDVRHLRLDLSDVKRISPKIASEFRRTFLQGNEVLVAVRGTLGGVVAVPTECAGYNISREVAMLALILPETAKAVAVFIGSSPLQQWLMRRTKGIAYTGINIETLKQLPIPVPSLAEQARIVAEVERRLSVDDEIEATVAADLLRAGRLRQAVLQTAFAVATLR